MFRQLISQLSGVVTGRLLASGAQAATIVLLARWAEPQMFGLVIAAQALLDMMLVVIVLGLPQYMGVVRARDPQSATVDAIFCRNRMTSSVTVLAYLVILVGLGLHDPVFFAILPLALASAIEQRGSVWDRIAVADGRIGLFSSNLVLRRVMALILFVLLHLAGTGVVLAYCSAALVSQLIYNFRMHLRCDYTPIPRRNSFRTPLFKESKHFWVDSMSGMLRQLDVAAAGVILGPGASGYLAVPSRIASPLMLLPTSFATLVLPRVSRGGIGAAKRSLVAGAVVTTLIAVLLAVTAIYTEEFVRFFLGGEYLPSVPVIRIYFIGFVGLSLIYILGAVLQGLGQQAAVGRVAAVFSVIALALLCAGAFLSGLEAAAWGFVTGVLGHLIGLVVVYIYGYRKIFQPEGTEYSGAKAQECTPDGSHKFSTPTIRASDVGP